MSHPTCCSVSLDRCDRCDLLVGLEGFHLIAVARGACDLVLDVESCNQLVGCPGCGVIAQGHGRVVVEVIDAPWAGVPARIRWHKRRWICRKRTCETVTFLEHIEKVCAPRARLGVRAIRWAIRQLRFKGATTCCLARQLATTWNTVWSHIKPCLQAASDAPARFAGVLGVDEHVWHHQDRRRRGPRELNGIVGHSQGGSSHGPLEWTWSQAGLAPYARTGWPSAANTFAPVSRSRRWIPSRDSKNAIAWPASRTPPACSMPSISSSSLATLQVRCVVASSKTRPVTAGARVIPSTKSGFFCAPHARKLTPRQQERLREAFTADEAHISVEVAYHCAQQVREVFHQDTPTQGRHLAAHHIKRLPTCPIPEIARLGRTLRKWKDALDTYYDIGEAINAPHRSHQQTSSN